MHGDCLDVLATYADTSIDLIVTSPPYGLICNSKIYDNTEADKYLAWFKPFAEAFYRILKDNGSLVIEIGGIWNKGTPTRNLYHFELLIMLCRECNFHLAQALYWWNPTQLAIPLEWVRVRHLRIKDAVKPIWWLSKTPWPRVNNLRVRLPYSQSTIELLRKSNGCYTQTRSRPWNVSDIEHHTDKGAAISSNLLVIPKGASTDAYRRYCQDRGIPPHLASFPPALPEYFIRMLSDPGDFVVDPFGGSCVTGAVCERLKRRWVCVEQKLHHCEGALGRFQQVPRVEPAKDYKKYYRIAHPGFLWTTDTEEPLAHDGGQKRSTTPNKSTGCIASSNGTGIVHSPQAS